MKQLVVVNDKVFQIVCCPKATHSDDILMGENICEFCRNTWLTPIPFSEVLN